MTEALIEIGRLPNLKKLIIPDPGYTILDMDLSRADVNVVGWDSGDEALKEKLKEERRDPTKDMHTANALTLFGYADYTRRQFAKVFCHGTNYGARPATLAKQCGVTVHESEKMQMLWFSKHPDILTWQKKIRAQVTATRTIKNAFGYRMFYFDRVDSVFNEALAWIPQSTVALVINKAMLNIMNSDIPVEVLMQVHDSLTMQCETRLVGQVIPMIRKVSEIVVPYADPLIIPVGFKTSEKSWGECKDWKEAA